MTARRVALNDEGHAIGEGHHRAQYSDALVRAVRDMHEHQGMRYAAIVAAFQRQGVRITYAYVKKLCLYQRRNQFGYEYRTSDREHPPFSN